MRRILKQIFLILLVLLFLPEGVLHFHDPVSFINELPFFLQPPIPGIIVWGIGGLEIIGSICLLIPRARRIGGVALIIALIGLIPINIFMAMNPRIYRGLSPGYLLWFRLAVNLFLIWFTWWLTKPDAAPATVSGESAGAPDQAELN